MGTLYTGGKIYTLVREGETVEAVYADNGKIVQTGTVYELKKKWKDHIGKVIDLQGKMMIPGLIDSHLHIIGHGEKLISLDLSSIRTTDELRDVILSYAENLHQGEWLIGEGWNENEFPDRKMVHRHELDEWLGERPVFLTRICRHAGVANSEALRRANIDETTPDPPGGLIERDTEGKPTGLLYDQAVDLIKQVFPPVSRSYVEKALTASIDDLLSKGLVGGHSEDLSYYGSLHNVTSAYKKVFGERGRRFKANLLIHHHVLEEWLTENQWENEYVEYGAVKIFADGAFGGRTALLSAPYSDAPETNGLAIHTDEELFSLVQKARRIGRPVAVHTIGDLSLEKILQAIIKSPELPGKRDRIIHAGLIREDLIQQMKELSIVLDIQPSFVSSDFPWLAERLGNERIRYAFAWKRLLHEEIPCAGGSDAPIETADPLVGIYAAVTRRKPGETHDGYVPEEKLTMFEALKLYTSGSAYAIGAEHTRGLILEGFEADFTVFDRDLFSIPEEEILSANVQFTIIDNIICYENKEEQSP